LVKIKKNNEEEKDEVLYMDDIIAGHSVIMDRYDPDKRVGLIVDEWGTWYDVEPGTNPGFLYQQNTIRDALVTGIHLNIFNQHCDRVQMANMAQLVNVLQAVILTEGEKMILTPTYHVFNMYKVHQDADLLSVSVDCDAYRYGDSEIPQVSVSASVDTDDKIHISLCNLNPVEGAGVECTIRGGAYSTVQGSILTAPVMNAHNTFEEPAHIAPRAFRDALLQGDTLDVSMPPMSVIVLTLE
jgi:alpha-N-arabinofuranosidase